MPFLITVALLAADQISKIWARTLDVPMEIIPDWFDFYLVFNSGFAFSLPAPRWILVGLAAVVSVVLAVMIVKKKFSAFAKWGAVFVIAGALGNAIDRVLAGVVTDFLAVANFPVFNLADTWVTVGAVLLVLDELFGTQIKK